MFVSFLIRWLHGISHGFMYTYKRKNELPIFCQLVLIVSFSLQKVVAIKKMEVSPFKEADSEREFRVEVDILSRLDHPNLVSLIGYCADGKHRFLVYEYMRNGNLQDHLNGKPTDIPGEQSWFNSCTRNSITDDAGVSEVKMNWPLRLKAALGAARGLAYLHSSTAIGIPIVHRDFKSTNILLSENFDAKVNRNTKKTF